MGEEVIASKSYMLYSENGELLGEVILTSYGVFTSVTNYGNFSCVWQNFGKDFREFILRINNQQLGTKLYAAMDYPFHSEERLKACDRFADKILPALQNALREEIKLEEAENL